LELPKGQKIDRLGLADEVLELLANGYSNRAVEKHFAKRQIKVTKNTVREWKAANKKKVQEAVKNRSTSIHAEQVEKTLKIGEYILKMNAKAEKVLQAAEDRGNYPLVLKSLDQLARQLKLYNDLIGTPPVDYETEEILKRVSPDKQEAMLLLLTDDEVLKRVLQLGRERANQSSK
jgi:hypothetical protein